MTKINLRDYYPFYRHDNIIEVPDEVGEALLEFDRKEAAYKRRLYRHKAYYSLDRGDGIEHDILFVSLSPSEIYERKVTYEQLHSVITSLPEKQAKRIYAYYFLNMSKAAIARAEKVSGSTVGRSIAAGLRHLGKLIKKL